MENGTQSSPRKENNIMGIIKNVWHIDTLQLTSLNVNAPLKESKRKGEGVGPNVKA